MQFWNLIAEKGRRYENVFNFRFPVTVRVYNDYFLIFYVAEAMIIMILSQINVTFNSFFVSICCVMIAQYEVITRAYENVFHDDPQSRASPNGKSAISRCK